MGGSRHSSQQKRMETLFITTETYFMRNRHLEHNPGKGRGVLRRIVVILRRIAAILRRITAILRRIVAILRRIEATL